MRLLITTNELDLLKSREKVPIKCEQCRKVFHRPKNDVQWALKSKKRNLLVCCSIECRQKRKDKRKNIACKNCGKTIKKQISEIKKHNNSFCSSSCCATYWNAHKTWGSTRSKLELWIEEQLTSLYPILEIHFNKTNAINAELDIYIPLLKLAFELNGIFHYEPVFGKEKLKSTKTNDNRKFQACLEREIELCIIDTHNVKYLKKERDKKFLDIVIGIIDKKLAENTGFAPVLV